MLSVSAYPQQYVDDIRARIADQVSAFAELASAVRGSGRDDAAMTALDRLEPEYFATLVIALDSCFVHRSRGQEWWRRRESNPRPKMPRPRPLRA